MAEPVLGIDLGTSNSVVAVVREGKTQVVTDPDGNTIFPSVVSFHPTESMLVGFEGKKRRLIDPKNTIHSAKRLIGRVFSDPAVQDLISRVPYQVFPGEHDQAIIVARGREWTVPEISALVLHRLKMLSERFVRQSVRKAVITVPANFNDAQRAATRAAGEIAGFEVLRVINEPTAAALAYGYGKRMDRRVLVYDFGGGTFDVTILNIAGDVYEVLATSGNMFLGGDDLDERLVAKMCDQFLAEHRIDLRMSEAAMPRLRAVAEQVKIELSARDRAEVQVKEIGYGASGEPVDLEFVADRASFESDVGELIDRTFAVCDSVFQLARLSQQEIDEVILVGGSTRVPAVRQRVQAYFGRKPMASINPDEVVAVGAAIQGAALMQDVILPVEGAEGTEEVVVQALLLDVTPLSLGIATVGGYTNVIIPRNAQVPAEESRVFSTSADNQTVVNIRVCQGEDPRFDANTPLGELQLRGLRPGLRGEIKLEVSFEIDTDGILRVRAKDPATGLSQDATIEVLGTLDDRQLQAAKERHRAEIHNQEGAAG